MASIRAITVYIFLLCRPHGLKVYRFVGDGSGVIHVGPNQIVIGQFADHELFNVNVYVHRQGHFHLPPTFSCYGISITTRWVQHEDRFQCCIGFNESLFKQSLVKTNEISKGNSEIGDLLEKKKLFCASFFGNQLKVKSELIVTCSCAICYALLPHTDLF